LLFAFSEIT